MHASERVEHTHLCNLHGKVLFIWPLDYNSRHWKLKKIFIKIIMQSVASYLNYGGNTNPAHGLQSNRRGNPLIAWCFFHLFTAIVIWQFSGYCRSLLFRSGCWPSSPGFVCRFCALGMEGLGCSVSLLQSTQRWMMFVGALPLFWCLQVSASAEVLVAWLPLPVPLYNVAGCPYLQVALISVPH
jgi:hypothetical protein